MGSGFWAPETPSKAAEHREPGSPSPASPYGERGPGEKIGLHCFLDPRRVGAVVCCLRRVSICRMQLTEARLGPSVLRALVLIGRAGSGGMAGAWAQKAFAHPILLPHEGEPVGSGFRAPDNPSKAEGPREPGQPSPGSPYGERGPGAKTACVAFSIRGALGLWFAARGEFPFAECGCQKLVWGRRCDWASALSGRTGSGGMAGAWAQKTGPQRCAAELAQGAWLGTVRMRPSSP